MCLEYKEHFAMVVYKKMQQLDSSCVLASIYKNTDITEKTERDSDM